MLNFERQQQNYLSMIENSLHLYLPEEGQGQDILFQAMAYSLENGGKRIRPYSHARILRKRAGKIHMPHCPLPVRWK